MAEKTLKSIRFPGSSDVYKFESSGGGGSSVQPDYAQTDSTQPDFIKNKIAGYVMGESDTISLEIGSLVTCSDVPFIFVETTNVDVTEIEKGSYLTINSGGTFIEIDEEDPALGGQPAQNMKLDENCTIFMYFGGEIPLFVISSDNYTLPADLFGQEMIFPKAGFYLPWTGFVEKIRFKEATFTAKIIERLPQEFLPQSLDEIMKTRGKIYFSTSANNCSIDLGGLSNIDSGILTTQAVVDGCAVELVRTGLMDLDDEYFIELIFRNYVISDGMTYKGQQCVYRYYGDKHEKNSVTEKPYYFEKEIYMTDGTKKYKLTISSGQLVVTEITS